MSSDETSGLDGLRVDGVPLGGASSTIQHGTDIRDGKREEAKRCGVLDSFVELVREGAPAPEPGLDVDNGESATFEECAHSLGCIALPYVTDVDSPGVLVGDGVHRSGAGEPSVTGDMHQKVTTRREGAGQLADCRFVIGDVLEDVEGCDQVK